MNPGRCDVCSSQLVDDYVDGKLRVGPWANLCLDCHRVLGVGLGEGKGQRYRRLHGDWVKVEG